MAIAFGGKVDFFREISTRSFASPPLINKLSKVENTESGRLTKDSHAVLRVHSLHRGKEFQGYLIEKWEVKYFFLFFFSKSKCDK